MNQQQIGDYQINWQSKLGSGATGNVYYGQNVKKGYKVAAKQIDIKKITPSIEKQIENEINILTNLSSPFIVKLYDYFRCGNYLYLFLQYCQDGDLKKFLSIKKKGGVCQAQALMFMRHIIQGYKQLYSKNIIHRDIKPANILLKQGIAKLSDFGFSRVVSNPDTSQKLTLLGTPIYTAIQILMGQIFSSKCDVWSLGIVFYEMLNEKTPWNGKDLQDLRKSITNKPLEFQLKCQNQQIKQLISQMLKLDSKQRISWQEIFNHPLFLTKVTNFNNQQQSSKNFQEIKNYFLEYLKQSIAKSYLRFNMNGVSFRDSFDPSDPQKQKIKSIINKIQTNITHQRNVAFLYTYMLCLYYKNKNLIPKSVNQCMQFEYALTFKAFKDILSIGKLYFGDQNPKNINNWQLFKQSSQYDELKKILITDYRVLDTLRKKMKKQAQKKFNHKQLPNQTGTYFMQFEKNFDNTFIKVMKKNQQEFKKQSNKGVCSLMVYYISQCALNPNQLLKNQNLDFGSFYQTRQHQYGLS